MLHKLLLADDSVTIQRVIELTFADEDMQVIAVGDGKEAIRRIESDRPDIVLADVGMPEMDGYEVAAYVKNTPHLAHIPVLLLTGAFEPVDEKKAQEVGCDGVLAKPFEPQMVITRVNELLAAAPPPRGAGVAPAAATAPPAGAVPPTATAQSASSAPTPVWPIVDNRPPAPRAAAPTAAPPAQARPPARSPLDTLLGEAAPEWSGVTAPPPAAPDSTIRVPGDVRGHQDPTLTMPARTAAPAPVTSIPDPPPTAPDGATVRISRRTPIAVPGFGAPALPVPGTTAALDDYFDRLDAAFATLHTSGPAPSAPSPAGEARMIPPRLTDEVPVTRAEPPARREPAPPVEARPVARPPQPPPARLEPAPVEHAPALAQAFSALLAAEHGASVSQSPMPAYQAGSELPPEVIDDLVARVTEAVLARMSDRVVRDTVTDIVSRVSERLVRDEIDRVKATIK